jgi:hypothetical protein
MHLALQRLEVGGVDRRLGGGADAEAARALHQVGVMAAQVDRAQRADRPVGGDVAGQPMR